MSGIVGRENGKDGLWRPTDGTKRRADWLALLLGQETAKVVETDPYCDARAQFQGPI